MNLGRSHIPCYTKSGLTRRTCCMAHSHSFCDNLYGKRICVCVCVSKGCSPFVVTVKPWFYSLRCSVPPSSLFILGIVVGRKGLEDTLWYTLVNTQSSSLMACRSYACDARALRVYFLKQLEHMCVPSVISAPLLFRWCNGKSQCQRRYSVTKALLSRAETEATFCFFSVTEANWQGPF